MSVNQSYAEQNGYNLLSKFKSLKEFNNHFEQVMALHKDIFTKSEYIALNKLRKFAADFFGVAWCKLQKAVAGTHKDELFGVSRSSFERMLRKAKKINLITVINQERENKWQKHNVYVFNRLEELTVEEVEIVSKSHTIDVPEDKKIEAPITKNLYELKKNKNTYAPAQSNDVHNNDKVLAKQADEYTPYERLKGLVTSCIDDAKLTYKLYGVWLAQTKKLINKPSFELGMKAARVTLRAVRDKKISNIAGYFNNTLAKMIDKVVEENLRSSQEEQELKIVGHDTNNRYTQTFLELLG